MRRLLPAMVLLAVLGGCAPAPFRGTDLVPLEGRDPATLLEEFRRSVPGRFRVLSSIVFELSWNRLSALGVTEVNAEEGTFTALGMNPLGVKLFEIRGDRTEIDPRFVFEALRERGDAARAIGEDIRRIYLDLLPGPGASVHAGRTRIVFRERQGAGVVAYAFAGADGFLVEKAYLEDEKPVWRVRYYEYQRSGDKAYPMGIVLDNIRYGYRLTVRVKEILQ